MIRITSISTGKSLTKEETMNKKPSGNLRTYAGSIFLIITTLKSMGIDLQISQADIDVAVQVLSGAGLLVGVVINLVKRVKYYLGVKQ